MDVPINRCTTAADWTSGADSNLSALSLEQWERAKEIFYAAVERPEGVTSSFIYKMCAGDAALQKVIESLLASDQSAENFLRTPAIAKVALSAMTVPAMPVGQRLGPYEILGLLGSGGMGEVYHARDSRLGRAVALKVLLADVTHDDTYRRWFKREARAAAALEHPNICPIYDIGEQDERTWIAMQYVEGETLAARLRRGPLDVLVALDLAVQIANALKYAHGRGIVHRDIKPENVMIAADGQAKVLDFGLAKITNEVPVGDDFPQPQSALDSTRLGTLPYMSPEQVRGELLDARTDVFSLSVVIYEIVAKRHPFTANTNGDVRAAILFAEPPLVTDFIPTASHSLAHIIRRGLQKDRELRYQTMSELAVDLDGVRRSRQRSFLRDVSFHMWGFAGALGLIVSLAAGSLWMHRRGVVNSTPTVEYVQLTNFPDSVQSPALSPDGRMLAFVRRSQSGAREDLYVKRLPDGEPRALTHVTDDDGFPKEAPDFTPDGSGIVFTGEGHTSFLVPVAGGATTLFKTNASGLHWIGPGQLLFSEMKKAPNMGIVTLAQGQKQPRDVYLPASATGMAHFSERSPDGTQVLVVEMDNVWLPCRVVPFDGSSIGRRVGPADGECRSATWSPEGKWMYFVATVNGESHIWRQRYPDGLPEQVTFGPNQERGVVVAPDGRSIITAVGARQSTVWYHDERGDRQISVEGYAYRPSVSPDETKVFYLVGRATKRSFSIGELWAADLTTGRNERVLPEFLVSSYDVSPDGKFFVFDAFDRDDRSRVWIARTDRSQPARQLTPSGSVEEQRPFFGASGDIYFMRDRSQSLPSLYRMNADGTDRRQLVDTIPFLVNVSPDGKWAVLWNFFNTSLLPLTGGTSRQLCSTCGMGPIRPDSPMVSWSSDNRTMLINIGKGTILVPSEATDTLSTTAAPSPTDLQKLPGARYIPESSIAPGHTAARYAFARQAEQSNLYRIRLR